MAPVSEISATEEIEFHFDWSTHTLVLDLQAISHIPFDPDAAPVKAFRALVFESGKVVHAPTPGTCVTTAAWHSQDNLALVHFKAATQRKPEFLLSFTDYSMLNSSVTGIYVESLSLPLQKAKNVAEDTPRFTKIGDITGFSSIDLKKMPWVVSVKQALLKQKGIISALKLVSQAEMAAYMEKPLQEKFSALQDVAKGELQLEMEGLERQDARAAAKKRAALEARLDRTMECFAALPLATYAKPLEERVTRVELAALSSSDEHSSFLRTPERRMLQSSSAELVRTTLAIHRQQPPTPVRPITPITTSEPAPAHATQVSSPPEQAEPSDAPSEEDEDEEEVRVSSRKRNAPERLGTSKVPKRRAKSNGALKEGKASKSKAPAKSAEALRNPRTGLPYKRGPYGPKSETRNVMTSLAKTEETSVALKNSLEVKALKDHIKDLQAQLVQAKEAIAAEKRLSDAALNAAVLKAVQEGSEKAAGQYKAGLHDGARLVSGRAFIGLGDTPGTMGTSDSYRSL